jgi:hypothetical protein
MKPADSTGGRLFGCKLNNAPAAPSTFGTISSDRGKGALQFTRIADHNPPHRKTASLRNCIHFCEALGQNLLCQNSVGDPDRSS